MQANSPISVIDGGQEMLSGDDVAKILDDLTCDRSIFDFPDISSDAGSFDDLSDNDIALVPELDLYTPSTSTPPLTPPPAIAGLSQVAPVYIQPDEVRQQNGEAKVATTTGARKPSTLLTTTTFLSQDEYESFSVFPQMLLGQQPFVPPSPPHQDQQSACWSSRQSQQQQECLASPVPQMVTEIPVRATMPPASGHMMASVSNCTDRQKLTVSNLMGSMQAAGCSLRVSAPILTDATVMPPPQCRGDGEGGWDTEFLEMSTVHLNRYLKTSDLTAAQIVALKTTRRRIKNRGYTQRSRARKAHEKCGKSSR